MYAIVRVRGGINARQDVRETLKMLNLPYVNNCVIIPDNKSYRGMLQKVKDYVTWGKINKGTLEKMLAKSGFEGKNLQSTVEKIMDGKATANQTIKLHPPVKGYEGIKKPYSMGGALGYRGKDINKLIERML